MKCRHCNKELNKVKDDNSKAKKNAVFEGICKNKDCEKYGWVVYTGVIKPKK